MTFKLKPRIALYSLGRSIDHDNEMIQVNGLTFPVLLFKPRIDWIASYYSVSQCVIELYSTPVSDLVVGSK